MKLMTLFTAAAMCVAINTTAAATNDTDLQIEYEHDSQGRVITRTALVYNGEDWQPALRWSYFYTPVGYMIEFSRWDPNHNCFAEAKSRTVFAFTPDATAAFISNYSRKDSSSGFELTDSFLAAYPDKDALDFLATNR